MHNELYAQAANRLHHLSMRYGAAMLELVSERRVGLLPSGQPGLKEARDFIDMILFTRAEINALTALLVKAKVFTTEEFQKQCTEEYKHFATVKAKQLGVEVTDHGLVITNPHYKSGGLG